MKVIQKIENRETSQGQKFNLIQKTIRQRRPALISGANNALNDMN